MAPEISIKKSFSGAPDNKVYNYKECEKTKRCSKEFSGLKKISRQMSAFKTISRGSKEMIVLEIKFTIAQEIVFLDRPNITRKNLQRRGD